MGSILVEFANAAAIDPGPIGKEIASVDWTHFFYFASIGLSLLGDVLIPVLFFRFERMESKRREALKEQREERSREFSAVHKRMDHLDSCFDTMRERILGEVASKADFNILRAEVEETHTRMRAAISAEIGALGQRVFRLEDKSFR